MEPQAADERLADVRPDPRPSPDHAGHDRWLVVRWTTDPADLSPDEVVQARALLAACTECAALSADLGLIARATAASVVPVRPRDFRIDPQQAAKARGSVLDRVRRWFGSPSSAAVRPLAGAGVAMGLVLVLLAPTLQQAGGAGADPQVVDDPQATAVLNSTPHDPAGPDAAAGAQLYATDDPPTAESDVTMIMTADSPSPTPDLARTAARLATDDPDAVAAEAPEDGAVDQGELSAGQSAPDDTTFALTLLGIILAGVGAMVLVLSWLARRWQDPLLR